MGREEGEEVAEAAVEVMPSRSLFSEEP